MTWAGRSRSRSLARPVSARTCRTSPSGNVPAITPRLMWSLTRMPAGRPARVRAIVATHPRASASMAQLCPYVNGIGPWKGTARRSRPSCRRSPDAHDYPVPCPDGRPARPAGRGTLARQGRGGLRGPDMTSTPCLSFIHRFEPRTEPGRPPLLLLHGTGGDEGDLLPLGRAVAPRAALLAPRSKVLENGMPRFFRRLAEGVFDEDDVRRRVDELAGFVAEAREAYGLEAPVAVGFSNGANIAAALLLRRPETLAGAALLRAMVPLSDPPPTDLTGKSVLLLSGAADPIVAAENASRLAATLGRAGADVRHRTLPAGHGLSQADVAITKAWIENL